MSGTEIFVKIMFLPYQQESVNLNQDSLIFTENWQSQPVNGQYLCALIFGTLLHHILAPYDVGPRVQVLDD